MAKKRKGARPVRVTGAFGDWLTRSAQVLSKAEGRNVSVVEVTARLNLWLEAHQIDSLREMEARP